MLTQFFSVGFIILLSAMLPGPDFAIVTKNTILHSRRAGLFTTLGIASACMIHVSYCILGLALVISESVFIFNCIKYAGAAYLFYLGIMSLRTKTSAPIQTSTHHKTTLSNFVAFRQGFICNIFNPKATLFFLALFTVIIKPSTPMIFEVLFAIELFVIVLLWFSTLTLLLSHRRVIRVLNHVEKYIAKVLGVAFILFGVGLVIY